MNSDLMMQVSKLFPNASIGQGYGKCVYTTENEFLRIILLC